MSVRNTTASKTLTIKNSSKTGTLIGSVAALSAPFTVTAGSGAFILAPGQEETVTVQFAPTSAGAASTSLVIASNDPKHPSVNVKITGTSVAGSLSVSPVLIFSTTAVGTSSTKVLTIRNIGAGVLHGNVGASTGPFVVIAGSGPFTLNDGKTWTVTLQFTPVEKGAAAGVLSILSDDPKHLSVNVNLKGTGK